MAAAKLAQWKDEVGQNSHSEKMRWVKTRTVKRWGGSKLAQWKDEVGQLWRKIRDEAHLRDNKLYCQSTCIVFGIPGYILLQTLIAIRYWSILTWKNTIERHNAVRGQGHSRSPILVLVESPYASFYIVNNTNILNRPLAVTVYSSAAADKLYAYMTFRVPNVWVLDYLHRQSSWRPRVGHP